MKRACPLAALACTTGYHENVHNEQIGGASIYTALREIGTPPRALPRDKPTKYQQEVSSYVNKPHMTSGG